MLSWLRSGKDKKRMSQARQVESAVEAAPESREPPDEVKEPPSEIASSSVTRRPSQEVYREPAVNEALFPKAQRIARSLQEAPEEWEQSADGFTIYHRDSGYAIWIANEDYKMGERISVDGFSRTIPYSKAEAMIIWPAVASALKHIGERQASEFFDKPVRARLRQRTSDDVWVCQDMQAKKPWVGIGETPDEAYRVWLGANYPRYREEVMQGRPMVAWRG